MGKATGFLEYERSENKMIPVKERIRGFDEFYKVLDEEERRTQGARCMNCGVPFCQSGMKLSGMYTGCPLHNLIPEWNDAVYKALPDYALARLLKTNNFPEFTGRVCPALCEKACICGLNDDPVTVHDNEKYIIETAFANGKMQPRIPKIRSGKKVAVIGSGPSGLAIADRLNQRGHSVTVFEREDRIGGLLMYGIPNMKLDKNVIFRRQRLMEAEGVEFRTGCDVGVNTEAADILKEFDAVALCCGAKQARGLAVDGFDTTEGVHFAVDFLTSTTKSLLETGLEKGTFIDAKGKNVVIVGGGDTGNDCVGTCIRHGCKSVTQIEMMSAPPVERRESNPWPEWPLTLKVDYGQLEAIELFGSDPRIYDSTVKSLITKNGRLTGVEIVKVHFENRQMIMEEGTEKKLKCELLLVAAGFTGCQDYTAKAFGVNLTPRNVVATEEDHYKTNVDKVFTAGDMHRGQSLVVWGIAEGRRCAREIDEYLMGYTNLE